MQLSVARSVTSLGANEWDAMCDPDFPFADHAHLLALERAACVGAESGWIPFVALAKIDEKVLGALPFYLKDNSYGEFIFDHAWAQAYARHGLAYFPKLVVSVPFTPATGQKVLATPGGESNAVHKELLEQALAVARATKCSTAHVLFIPPGDVPRYEAQGWIVRHSFQYHWHNAGYKSFDDFLSALTSKRRRQIALERRQLAADEGLFLETVTGEALTPEHARIVDGFYQDTNERKGSLACLNEEFFREIFSTMKDHVVLFLARREGRIIAAALNFQKGKRLFGRYWGCTEEVRNLHFELCYYRAIEHCIAHGLEAYEAGAQGEHKVPRGFLPTLTYSAHQVFHPAFREAITRAVEDEKSAIARLFDSFAEHSPYRPREAASEA